MMYMALYVMFLSADPLLGLVGVGWALEISTFLGPKWHSPNGLMPYHRAQPPPNCPRSGSARIKNITYGAV